MAVIHDLYCENCDKVREDWVDNGRKPRCPNCGGPRRIQFSKVNTDLDHLVYAPSVDTERMVTVREARAIAKKNGLNTESAYMDKHHGARNDGYKGIGRLYSGGGLKGRSGYSKDYGRVTMPDHR